jgi:hypothetical protein
MILEFHDAEEGNTLSGRVEVDYDYQAEEWVKQEGFQDEKGIVRIVLKADDGTERAVWELSQDKNAVVKVSGVHGDWKIGTAWSREQWHREYHSRIAE